jgi:hypothetical protein
LQFDRNFPNVASSSGVKKPVPRSPNYVVDDLKQKTPCKLIRLRRERGTGTEGEIMEKKSGRGR